MQNQTIEGYRLSPQQKHLWFLQKDSYAYRTQVSVYLEGELKLEVLKEALHRVANQHEILRTTFHQRPGIRTPIQIIADSGKLSWKNISLCHLAPKEREAKVKELLEQERHFVFDLEQGPLLHLSLLKLSANRQILLVSMPSLCADSWSLKNLVQEISDTYAACLEGEELSNEPVQYIQFSEWQNELLEEEEAQPGRTYWHQQDIGSLPALTLPFEKKSSEQRQFTPDIHALKIEPNVVAKLEANATLNNTTIAEFLLACWQTLLWRLTGQSDIVVSTVFNGRKYEELHETLGLLAKWLPVHCPFQENFQFTEILSQIGKTFHNHYKWQEYFLWETSEESIGDTEKFPISFEFEEWPNKSDAGGVSFSLYQRYVCFELFKVKLTCLQTEESTIAEFHYDASLFSGEDIERLAEQFLTLVESAAHNPEATVSELEILSKRDRHQLLLEFNNTQTHYPQNKCIHQLFEEQVERTPDQVAVVFENQQLTYAELNACANQLAHYLQQLGIEPEVLVGLYAERSLEIVIGLLGILKAGGAYLPLDPALPVEGLAFRLQDAQSPVLLTQQSLAKTLPQLPVQIVSLDADWQNIAQSSDANLPSITVSNNLAYTLFTSGSTGTPKGVAVEHGQLLNYIYGITDRLDLPIGSSFATVSTFAADLGNTSIFSALCMGGCLHVVSQERASDPEALADYFRRYPIDCLKIVPSHLAILLASSQSRYILPYRRLILGGEAASWELIETIQQRSPGCQIFNHYGPTETTVGVLADRIEDNSVSDRTQTVPLGRPLANTQVYVLDQQLHPVPIGVPGELYIGGGGLARGYLNRPELTSERFIPNPFVSETRLYKTGDVARYLPDGKLEFLGRTDYQIKVRGFRIEVGEIETLLGQHPGVRHGAVVVWGEQEEDKRLVAYVVPHPKQVPSVSDLRHFLSEKLPEFMIPSAFVKLKSLPLTPNGKVDRRALPAPEQSRIALEEDYVAPRTPLEEQLTKIWAKVLGIERVGIHNNFFELGGHSLLLTQLLVQIRDTIRVDLSLQSLFASPTVASVAEKIEAEQKTEPTITSNQDAFAQLHAEAVLDDAICPNAVPFHPLVSENAIFLTGATGFLGAFLLYELLQQTAADIYCLVRSSDLESSKQKLQKSLASYCIWDESFRSRIIPLLGDLSQPLLGLSEEQFQWLAKTVDTVYHNGAWVHHTSPYTTLKAANVLGTQEVLRLATQVKRKPVHFVSTTSVFSLTGHSGARTVREDESLDNGEVPSNGYAQSKWVAEKLVTLARDRGLPVCIYRPGRISGHSETGVFNVNDFLYKLILGCIQLGSAPEGNATLDIAPVDYVSRAIVCLSRQKEYLGKAFHLVNSHPLHSNKLIEQLRSLGYSIQQVPYDQWRTELLNIARHSPEHTLYPLVPFFPARETQKQTSPSGGTKFDCQNTLAGLANTSVVCPPVDSELLNTYFSYLIHGGFLSPPQLSAGLESSSKRHYGAT